MQRDAMDALLNWKNNPRHKPLMVFGARQVGKSYLLERFAKEGYQSYVVLNLEQSASLRTAFEGDLSPRTILSNLSQLVHASLPNSDMLIVLDEIQACPNALTSLKYFQEQLPDQPIIGAGSLLGVAVRERGASYPVGKVDTLTLHPMTFGEFLVGIGEEAMLDGIRDAYERRAAYPLHERAMELYRAYLLVGGMPEAVKTYRESRDTREAARVHHAILDLYLTDMAKYAQNPTDIAKARDAWLSMPAQLAKENHKFQYKTIRGGARASRYEGALEWLLAAGLTTRCMRVSSGQVPLPLQEDASSFKMYVNDTGLLCTMSEVPHAALFDDRLRPLLHAGGITENYVAQQLVAQGIIPRYWTSGNTAEVDFVVEDGSALAVPIEVKSTTHVRSKSLGVYARAYDPQRCVRVSARNFGQTDSVESIPLYAVGVLASDLARARRSAGIV